MFKTLILSILADPTLGSLSPFMYISPVFILSSPPIAFKRVVLPHPEGPHFFYVYKNIYLLF